MNVLIIEENRNAGEQTKNLLSKIDNDEILTTNVYGILAAKFWLQSNPKPDIIISETKFEDGCIFDLAKQLPIEEPVILTSKNKKYALEAFGLNTISYIIKPLEY